MKNLSTRAITLTATLAALCAVTGLMPYVFFLPVTVAASTLSIGMAAAVGLSFGLISVAYSFIMPGTVVATAFMQAPYLAIFPRIAAALTAFAVMCIFRKFTRKKSKAVRFIGVSVSAAIGSLANTAIVVGLLVLIFPTLQLGGVTVIAYAPIMLISGAIECVCMAVLTPPISLTLEKTALKTKPRGFDRKAQPSKIYNPQSDSQVVVCGLLQNTVGAADNLHITANIESLTAAQVAVDAAERKKSSVVQPEDSATSDAIHAA